MLSISANSRVLATALERGCSIACSERLGSCTDVVQKALPAAAAAATVSEAATACSNSLQLAGAQLWLQYLHS